MKWWDRITVLFLILSVGVNILLAFRVFQGRKLAEQLAEKLRTARTPDQQVLSWERYLATMILYQDFQQRDIQVTGTDKRSVPLSSLVADGPVLVFRYKSTDCGQCVDFGLLKLKKLAAGIGADHISVLVGESDRRLIEMLRRQHEIDDIPFYQAEGLDTPAETVQYPYCFVLDKAMRIHAVFVPDKAYPYSMDLYLKMIAKRYLSTADDGPEA